MTRSPRPRKTAQPSDSLHRRLNMYALGAGAAGVSALALVQPAEAKIVYTPANTPVSGKLFIDLNHDGIADFQIASTSICSAFGCAGRLIAIAEPGNGIAYALNQTLPLALALMEGRPIGSKRGFAGYAIMLTFEEEMSRTHHEGYWFQLSRRYLGLRFQIRGKIHYGWARFNVKNHRTFMNATLTGYAYETIPGKAIIAGATKGPDEAESSTPLNMPASAPATLGALALGARGLSIWRREEEVTATLQSLG